MIEETWVPVAGYEGLYEVSNTGKIKSVKAQKLMKQHQNRGYLISHICKKGKHFNLKIHRAVAEAFIPNPEGKREVNHIDGNKMNNHSSNLEWVTPSENIRHARENGLSWLGKNNPVTSKAVDMFTKDGEYIKTFPSFMEANRETGVSRANIQGCCVGRYGCKTAGGFKWKYHDECIENNRREVVVE